MVNEGRNNTIQKYNIEKNNILKKFKELGLSFLNIKSDFFGNNDTVINFDIKDGYVKKLLKKSKKSKFTRIQYSFREKEFILIQEFTDKKYNAPKIFKEDEEIKNLEKLCFDFKKAHRISTENDRVYFNY